MITNNTVLQAGVTYHGVLIYRIFFTEDQKIINPPMTELTHAGIYALRLYSSEMVNDPLNIIVFPNHTVHIYDIPISITRTQTINLGIYTITRNHQPENINEYIKTRIEYHINRIQAMLSLIVDKVNLSCINDNDFLDNIFIFEFKRLNMDKEKLLYLAEQYVLSVSSTDQREKEYTYNHHINTHQTTPLHKVKRTNGRPRPCKKRP